MSTFLMPSLGADMESAVLMEWKVKEGDKVSKGDIIAEVETSKGVIEIEVFEDGVIEKLLVKEETECKVGDPLAVISSHSEEQKEPASAHEEKHKQERAKISPAARKRAKELGVDISQIKGEKETLSLKDIEPKTVQKQPSTSGMRQAIAKAMSLSNAEIPHYYLSTSINMTPALKWLEELNSKRSIENRVLPAALLIRAVVHVLKDVKNLNGFWKDDSLQVSDEINPGIAIALRKEGLITPAIIGAGDLGLDDTMKSLGDLIIRTRSGKLRGAEITKQTITITNLGDLGVQSVYGVIYPPQVALVGFGKIIDAPWAEGDALCVRKVMQATIAGDHRATDGRIGAEFLDKLDRILQEPKELL